MAVPVEDHPLDYIEFEGEIAEGQYGAGTVRIWDRGVYELESQSPSKIVVNLKGGRMRGRYALVKFSGGRGGGWLLFKSREGNPES